MMPPTQRFGLDPETIRKDTHFDWSSEVHVYLSVILCVNVHTITLSRITYCCLRIWCITCAMRWEHMGGAFMCLTTYSVDYVSCRLLLGEKDVLMLRVEITAAVYMPKLM